MKAAAAKDLELIDFPEPTSELPVEIVALAEDVAARVNVFYKSADSARIPAFVPSNPLLAYRLLASVVERSLATGPRFCEWGSGFGTVACLAAYLGLSAHGIEIEGALVAGTPTTRNTARDFFASTSRHGLSIMPIDGSDASDGD